MGFIKISMSLHVRLPVKTYLADGELYQAAIHRDDDDDDDHHHYHHHHNDHDDKPLS